METMSPTDTVRTPDSIVDEEESESPTRAELLELVEKMQHDWVKLNEILNRTALYYQWCGDYERRINSYNDHFKTLVLQGRSGRHNNWRQPDSYLLPSLRRQLAQEQTEAVNAEQALARVEQLRERERNVQRREDELYRREREVLRKEGRQGDSRRLMSRRGSVEYYIENGEISCRHGEDQVPQGNSTPRSIRGRLGVRPGEYVVHQDGDDVVYRGERPIWTEDVEPF
jgi:hypothetical protein